MSFFSNIKGKIQETTQQVKENATRNLINKYATEENINKIQHALGKGMLKILELNKTEGKTLLFAVSVEENRESQNLDIDLWPCSLDKETALEHLTTILLPQADGQLIEHENISVSDLILNAKDLLIQHQNGQ